MDLSSPGHSPRPGDLLLAQSSDQSLRFNVSVLGEPPQITYDSYPEALVHAERFARIQHVDVWRVAPGGILARVIDHRPVGTA